MDIEAGLPGARSQSLTAPVGESLGLLCVAGLTAREASWEAEVALARVY